MVLELDQPTVYGIRNQLYIMHNFADTGGVVVICNISITILGSTDISKYDTILEICIGWYLKPYTVHNLLSLKVKAYSRSKYCKHELQLSKPSEFNVREKFISMPLLVTI